MSETRNNAFWGWLVPALVALGLFFSIATHLRVLTGGAVGPGEMLLLAAAVLGWAFGKPWQQLKWLARQDMPQSFHTAPAKQKM